MLNNLFRVSLQKLLIAVTLLSVSASLQAESFKACNKHLNAFQNNPTYTVPTYHGKFAKKVVFDSKTRSLKTRFNEVLSDHPSVTFAGQYGTTMWGCGSPCYGLGLVNLKSGKAIYGPNYSDNIEFDPNSRIIVTDRPESQAQVNLISWIVPTVYSIEANGVIKKIYACKFNPK